MDSTLDLDDKKTKKIRFIVLLHGYASTPEKLSQVKKYVETQYPNSEVFCPQLALSIFSTANPDKIIVDLIDLIEKRINEIQKHNIDEIIFIGHSLGALLIRKLYIIICGETAEAPFENIYKKNKDSLVEPKGWADRVSRLILIASLNRGWSISNQLNISKGILVTFGVFIGNFLRLFNITFIGLTVRRGAEFITQLRIQWIRMRQRSKYEQSSAGNATVIQLLGSTDDIIAPEDNIDLVSGDDFIYLDVPYSGHIDIIDFNDLQNGEQRRKTFLLALDAPLEQLKVHTIHPSDDQLPKPNDEIKKMVFVIHGIRDKGYWTHKIARKIKYEAKKINPDCLDEWTTETSSYGYFPMLPFLFPWHRRKKVEWLMDQYAEAVARYPNAAFSYVGHSHGTYLLAKAFELYPCCKFDKVVFAGSVVRSNYNWQKRIENKQVNRVLNFVATRDWVVAIFPNFFELLNMQDLGSAGHNGFTQVRNLPQVQQVKYVKGGHDAGITEPMWNTIAHFVLDGTLARLPNLARTRSGLTVFFGKHPYIGWIGIALITSIIPLLTYGFWYCTRPWLELGFAILGFSTALYILSLWLILTRI